MDYSKQVNEFINYFKANEKDESELKIGVEIEHFVIDKDTLETVSYYGKGGVEETLEELQNKGWKGDYEGRYLLGAEDDNKYITLEPGSQLELSIAPKKDIVSIEREYLDFLHQIIPILDKKNQALIAIGYHPLSKIDDIKIIPKKRYDFMFEYFKTRGVYAHNMMKGTASFQVAIDYSSEEDYIKKFKTANGLSSVLYALFDNGYYFEGKNWQKHCLRSVIWENCDNDRCGIVPGTFDDDYGYRKYAEYILNIPPILMSNGQNSYSTGAKLVKEIFDPENYSIKELEHILTMVFPDVRTKKYIEIRMMDSVPYPLNLSAVALIKGIFYDSDNLNRVYEFIKDINMDNIIESRKSIYENGLKGKLRDKSVLEIGNWLLGLAKQSLDESEVKYIEPLEEMLKSNMNPYEKIRVKSELGRKESIKWCILNNII